MDTPLRVISLSAGVRSTAMLLMGLAGEFGPPPDVAIFADTGWEQPDVYAHLAWLEHTVAPFPIVRISVSKAAVTGERARIANACTKKYKITPLDRTTLQLLKMHGHSMAEKWIGISVDEAHRTKPSRHRRFVHRYPLVEHSIARQPGNRFALDDCLSWLARNGYAQTVDERMLAVGARPARAVREMSATASARL